MLPVYVAVSTYRQAIGATAIGGINQASVGGDALFHKIVWSSDQNNFALNITGLDASRTYQVQTLYGESRGNAFDGTITATDSWGNQTTTSLKNGPGNSPTEFAIATTVLSDSTSLDLALAKNQGYGPGFSGVVIHSIAAVPIPEPATMCALGLALAGLGGYVRKRRRA